MKRTDWTTAGHRVAVELTTGGMTVLSCQALVVSKAGEKLVRSVWFLSQLGIPVITTGAEAEKLVKHWLGYWEDEELSGIGLAAYREVISSVELQAENEDAVTGQSGGNLN